MEIADLLIAHNERKAASIERARSAKSMSPEQRLKVFHGSEVGTNAKIPVRSRHLLPALKEVRAQLTHAFERIDALPSEYLAHLPTVYRDRNRRTAILRDMHFIYTQMCRPVPPRDPLLRAYQKALRYRVHACRIEIERDPASAPSAAKLPGRPLGSSLRTYTQRVLNPTVPEKYCPHCRRTKKTTADNWQRCTSRHDGLQGYCRKCTNERSKARAQAKAKTATVLA